MRYISSASRSPSVPLLASARYAPATASATVTAMSCSTATAPRSAGGTMAPGSAAPCRLGSEAPWRQGCRSVGVLGSPGSCWLELGACQPQPLHSQCCTSAKRAVASHCPAAWPCLAEHETMSKWKRDRAGALSSCCAQQAKVLVLTVCWPLQADAAEQQPQHPASCWLPAVGDHPVLRARVCCLPVLLPQLPAAGPGSARAAQGRSAGAQALQPAHSSPVTSQLQHVQS